MVDSTSDPAGRIEFPISGVHDIGPMGVFRGSWRARILGMIAVLPFLSFPVQLAVFLFIGYPYILLELTIVLTVPVPVICWLIAAATHTTDVYVWRSYFDVPTLRREPWRKEDVVDLPARVWHRVADSQRLVPVIDALHDEVTTIRADDSDIKGNEFTPYEYKPDGADDELVSMMLRTEAAVTVYAARKVRDRLQAIKITGMLILIGVGMFFIWFAASSLSKPPA